MPPTIFLGTTTPELQECRQKVREALAKFLPDSVVMNADGWDGSSSEEKHLANILACDFFVCILGYCYGNQFHWRGKSVVEVEYDFARQQHKDCLVYEATDSFLIPAHLHERDDRWLKQVELRRRINSTSPPQTFASSAQLALNIARTLLAWKSGPAPYERPIGTENNLNIGRIDEISADPHPSPADIHETPLASPPDSVGNLTPARQPGSDRHKIALISLASPDETPSISEMFRSILEALDRSENRTRFEAKQYLAARMDDIYRCLMGLRPHIVHLVGLNNHEHPILPTTLGRLISILKDNIRCVILDGGWTEQYGEAVAQHIDCAIVVPESLPRPTVDNFTAAFYQALGFRRDLKTAYELGCLFVPDDADKPHLCPKSDRDPATIFF